MSEQRLKRRRFLADALFAGGCLGAAALTARWMQPGPPVPVVTAGPEPAPQPVCSETPAVDGNFEPVIRGRVAAPQQQELR